jgi:CubicO group peptidase (beta-lactamase class C family)
VHWRSATVERLVDTLAPALPATAVIAAVAADDGGYAVKLSGSCPMDGRFEIGSITKTMTGTVLASLVHEGVVALDDEIGRWLDGFQVLSLALERAASMPFGSILERRIFRPPGMTCSGIAGHGGGSRVHGHAQASPVRRWTHHLWGCGRRRSQRRRHGPLPVRLPAASRIRNRTFYPHGGAAAPPDRPAAVGRTRLGAWPAGLSRTRRRHVRLPGHAGTQAACVPRRSRLRQRPRRARPGAGYAEVAAGATSS